MNKIIARIAEKAKGGIFSDYEVATLLKESPHQRYGVIKRAIAQGDLLSLRRGLYAVNPAVTRRPIDRFEAAQRIYGPSYISLESALAAHGLIPEAVHSVTSVCSRRSVQFKTP